MAEFRTRFYDTQRFFDPYAGGKFAHYFFAAHKQLANNGHGVPDERSDNANGSNAGALYGVAGEQSSSGWQAKGIVNGVGKVDPAQNRAEAARHLIEEAALFVEAAYSCYNRMSVTP